jgi:hypothetical protein
MCVWSRRRAKALYGSMATSHLWKGRLNELLDDKLVQLLHARCGHFWARIASILLRTCGLKQLCMLGLNDNGEKYFCSSTEPCGFCWCSMVTCVFPSVRNHNKSTLVRTSVSFLPSFVAKECARGLPHQDRDHPYQRQRHQRSQGSAC